MLTAAYNRINHSGKKFSRRLVVSECPHAQEVQTSKDRIERQGKKDDEELFSSEGVAERPSEGVGVSEPHRPARRPIRSYQSTRAEHDNKPRPNY